MNYTVYAYVFYIPISIAVTIWVAQTLHKNGRVFLISTFAGNEKLADSVNHLLVVGFYLINIGYVTLILRYGDKPDTLQSAIEFLSTKLGLVLVVLGAMHFFNLYVFSRIYRQGKEEDRAPFTPSEHEAIQAMRHARKASQS